MDGKIWVLFQKSLWICKLRVCIYSQILTINYHTEFEKFLFCIHFAINEALAPEKKSEKKISYLKAETVHFEEHLKREQDDEEQVGDLLEVIQPWRLPVVLCGLQSNNRALAVGQGGPS